MTKLRSALIAGRKQFLLFDLPVREALHSRLVRIAGYDYLQKSNYRGTFAIVLLLAQLGFCFAGGLDV